MTEGKSEELHIASFLVFVRPEQSSALLDYLETQPQMEVHAAGPEGKLVVVVESTRSAQLRTWIDTLERFPGVLNCTLVYHETMDSSEAEQELITDNNNVKHLGKPA